MQRLFIAVDIDASVREQTAAICHGIPGVRWSAPEQLHITLRFIGDADAALEEELVAELDSVQASPFRLQLAGVGRFVRKGPTEVIWAGVHPSRELQELQREVEKACRRAGLVAERREFQAHVTLARPKTATDVRIREYLEQYEHFVSDEFLVEEFTLYSSQRRPEGPIHTVEEVFHLDPTAARHARR